MMPGRYNLETYRGDSAGWTFKLWQDTCRSVPFDLTDCEAKAEIRQSSGGPVLAALTLTIELPNIIHATAPDPLPSGKWDLQVTGPEFVRTVLAGSVTSAADITDSDPIPT